MTGSTFGERLLHSSTVPSKSKLPVSSRFSRDERLISRDNSLVLSLENETTLLTKLETLAKFLTMRKKNKEFKIIQNIRGLFQSQPISEAKTFYASS